MTLLLILLFYLFHYGKAQVYIGGPMPLLVRSPDLNCWGYQFRGLGNKTKTSTVVFDCSHSNWGLTSTFDMTVLVRVDNVTYQAVGFTSGLSQLEVLLTNKAISPTQTKFTMEAGQMQINLTFLNPIEREDWVKQSIPFSYLSLTAKSLDSAAHTVQVYSDIGPSWSNGSNVTYSLFDSVADNGIYHKIQLQSPIMSDEVSSLYYAMKDHSNGDTYMVSDYTVPKVSFLNNGTLDDTTDVDLNGFVVNYSSASLAISRDLGSIQATQDPIVWAVGLITDPVLNYKGPSGTSQDLSLYFKTQYLYGLGIDDETLINDFLDDFANASSRAQQFDLEILQDATPISGLLGDLVSFATAQVYGSIQLTIAIGQSGYFNNSDVMAFMKNMAGLDAKPIPGRVNAVETLYSAFPTFMHIDPNLGGLFLEPLFRLQASPMYTNAYAAPDLGISYPNVAISNSADSQGVEDSGNMLIMTYAHARSSGNYSLISSFYPLLASWADYLSNATLLIHDQISADGLATDNQTNLAIKGIIAINAMSEMSSIVERAPDVDKYSSTASNLYAQWKSLALTSDRHLLAAYGLADSWTMGYNLFADVWLGTNVVESSVYDGQSSFLNNLTASNSSIQTNGMPVDNLGSEAFSMSSWSLFVAAMTPNQDLRKHLILSVYDLGVYYYGQAMYSPIFNGGPSPGQGAMYAPLALKVPVLLVNSTATATPTATAAAAPSKSHIGEVVRGIIGGVAALLAIGTTALVVWHRRRQSHKRTQGHTPANAGSSFLREATDQSAQGTITPFNQTGLGLTEAELPMAAGLVHRPSSLEPLALQPGASFPVGLSSKELAQLRSNGLRSQPMDGQPSDPPSTAITVRDVEAEVVTLVRAPTGEMPTDASRDTVAAATSHLPTGTPPEALRLQLEDNLSRHELHEIRQLLVERSEPPPTYASRPSASNI